MSKTFHAESFEVKGFILSDGKSGITFNLTHANGDGKTLLMIEDPDTLLYLKKEIEGCLAYKAQAKPAVIKTNEPKKPGEAEVIRIIPRPRK